MSSREFWRTDERALKRSKGIGVEAGRFGVVMRLGSGRAILQVAVESFSKDVFAPYSVTGVILYRIRIDHGTHGTGGRVFADKMVLLGLVCIQIQHIKGKKAARAEQHAVSFW